VEATKDISLTIELAAINDSNGHEDKALELYEKLLQARPDLSVVKNNLAMILVRGEPNKADLDRALELTKDFTLSENPVFMDTIGWVHYMRGENKEALTLLKRAYEKGMKIPDISYHLGMAYLKAGSYKEAKERLEGALNIGRSFGEKEQAKQALEEIKAQEAKAGEAKTE
jgi:Tfp pilus assembly protein PilF